MAPTQRYAQVLNQLRCIVLSNVGNLFNADGTLKLPHELDAETRAAISSMEIDKNSVAKYKFWDKNVALDKVMKYLGLYESDNNQKTDALTTLIANLNGDIKGADSGNNTA